MRRFPCQGNCVNLSFFVHCNKAMDTERRGRRSLHLFINANTNCRERCLHRSALAIHCERISYILEITIYELLVKDIYASKKPLDIYFPAL